MAARLELLKNRKARLLKQNEAYRRDLVNEAENLREAVEWAERGFSFYKAAGRLAQGGSPFSIFRARKKQGTFAKLWRGCATGIRLWRNLRGI